MKHLLLSLFLLFCLVFTSTVTFGQDATKTNRDGFRDARLGAKLTIFKGMRLTSTPADRQQSYERASDDLHMGKGMLKSIIYFFEKGVLVDIHLKAAAGANGQAILEEITSVQGAPTQQATVFMGQPVRYWRTPAMLLTFVEGPQIRVSYALFSSLPKRN